MMCWLAQKLSNRVRGSHTCNFHCPIEWHLKTTIIRFLCNGRYIKVGIFRAGMSMIGMSWSVYHGRYISAFGISRPVYHGRYIMCSVYHGRYIRVGISCVRYIMVGILWSVFMCSVYQGRYVMVGIVMVGIYQCVRYIRGRYVMVGIVWYGIYSAYRYIIGR